MKEITWMRLLPPGGRAMPPPISASSVLWPARKGLGWKKGKKVIMQWLLKKEKIRFLFFFEEINVIYKQKRLSLQLFVAKKLTVVDGLFSHYYIVSGVNFNLIIFLFLLLYLLILLFTYSSVWSKHWLPSHGVTHESESVKLLTVNIMVMWNVFAAFHACSVPSLWVWESSGCQRLWVDSKDLKDNKTIIITKQLLFSSPNHPIEAGVHSCSLHCFITWGDELLPPTISSLKTKKHVERCKMKETNSDFFFVCQ